jgi:hypothetical protein
MQIYPVTQLLSDAGFAAPELRILNPNYENYTALLLQPQGKIEADANGVRNADQDLARMQYSAFLADAVSTQADIAITPEYSMPWQVFEDSVRGGVVPASGAIWVVGCESVTIEQLEAFRDRMSDISTVLYEALESQPGRFLDPVVYVFSSRSSERGDNVRLMMVVQFKTSPMGDDGHYEINGLQTGNRLYYFGNGTTQLRLATLICSDAFAFLDEHARELYDRTLMIHIQLNPKPRQEQYRQYRTRLMQFGGDQTELICLNWAKDVVEKCGETEKCWNNISGSAWYLRPDKFDHRDATLTANHKNGLYYTWLKELRCHALFFAYHPAVFLLTASKVAHIGVAASVSRRRGPILTHTRAWDNATSRWVLVTSVSDGFETIVENCGDAASDIGALASTNPFCAERALALCAGQISHPDWYSLQKLDSCMIGPSEIVRRVTACQDTEPEAMQFRTKRMITSHRVASLLKNQLPAALVDLQDDFRIDWSVGSPHTNVVSITSGRRATAIYLGDDYNIDGAKAVKATVAEYIGRASSDPDVIIEGRQRLHVWYRDAAGLDIQCDPFKYTQYDEGHTDSPVDITRSE